jgi:AcrR family transcriptional regulator
LTDSNGGRTFSDVHSEIASPSVGPDRRTRKREARRDHLLDLAAELVDRSGVDGLTMAALADAADYATASLYTYFPSRSALLAALQQRALGVLHDVATAELARWDEELGSPRGERARRISALARLWAFSDLFLDAPRRNPREFRLQQQLLVTEGAEDTADAATVVPAAMLLLEVPRRLIAAAEDGGALASDAAAVDPVGNPVAGSLLRTLAWVLALNGALLADRLATGMPTTGVALGDDITGALLRGWGAAPAEVASARRTADGLVGR